MGYSYYELADGREAGYSVDDICNEDGCTTEIDRGLSYLCGDNPHSDETGCTGYFCETHLVIGFWAGEVDPSLEHYRELPHQMCNRCADRWQQEQSMEDAQS